MITNSGCEGAGGWYGDAPEAVCAVYAAEAAGAAGRLSGFEIENLEFLG